MDNEDSTGVVQLGALLVSLAVLVLTVCYAIFRLVAG